jgi:hypothetical protein
LLLANPFAQNRFQVKSVNLVFLRQSVIREVMQATYHITGREVDAIVNTIRKLVQDGKELTITISSENKTQPAGSVANEKEQLFYGLFGSWQGEETGDELVKQIYADRVSGTRDPEL